MGMHSFFQLGMKNGNAFLFSSRNGNGNAFLKLRNGPMSGSCGGEKPKERAVRRVLWCIDMFLA